MKLIILIFIVIANIVAVCFSLFPAIVTYAEVPPDHITCGQCELPEIQKALTDAATFGRGTIIRQISSFAPWISGIALFNIGAFSFVIFHMDSKANGPNVSDNS